MRALALACIVLAGLTVLAPAAHVLEAPNKLTLNGASWLFVQQRLYRGWGPLIGAPAEILGLLLSLGALVVMRANARARIAPPPLRPPMAP